MVRSLKIEGDLMHYGTISMYRVELQDLSSNQNYYSIICLFESFPYCLLFERKIHIPEGITISCLVERTQVHLRLDDGNGFGYSFLLNTKNITFSAE